ncbi:MAG TPA: DUF4012 domain-containing protein [Patescibacteria group bacterium]|nr:DUF4012 domain-containing protein [Patescibacteria group bacterium]
MTTQPRHKQEGSITGQPIARIEAQDATWVLPLREYFERFGCRVVVNRNIAEIPTYVIGVGSASFVKHFIEDVRWKSAKKLVVVYEGDENELAGLKEREVKQYYVDPTPLDASKAKELCAFFFTGKGFYKNDRKGPPAEKKIGSTPKEALREDPPRKSDMGYSDRERIAHEMEHVYRNQRPSKRLGFSPWWGRWVAWMGILTALVVTPILFYLLSVGASTLLLVLSTKTIMSGKIRWTRALMTYSSTYRSLARSMLTMGSPVFMLLGQDGVIEDQDRLLSTISQIASAESGVLTVFQTGKEVAGGILNPYGTQQTAGVSDVMRLSTEVSRVSQSLGLVAAHLASLQQTRRFPFSTRTVASFTTSVISKLGNLRRMVDYADKMLTLYPRIAGFRKKQTYLVLLQNSMELRPTGGFIGSLVLLSFIDGKVESLEVQDVYTADGQLKGHVDPPVPIREILGSEHWYLRDSNWNPDFTVSGSQARWFYEKEMNQSVDGVIALSLPIVTKLLSVTGPVELLDFNERITESNFFAKSLLYTETGFFPGSTKKKDFLGALTSALLTRITTDPTIPASTLLTVLWEGIEARDVQFYFSDPELERLITQWAWHGGVAIAPCQKLYTSVPCVGDGVGVVDANLGVNKANFFITREAVSDITIHDNGDLEHTLTMSIRNTATPQESGAGAYLSYFRLLLPKDVELVGVVLDGNDVAMRKKETGVPPPAPYWTREDAPGFAEIHVPFSVIPGQKRQLTVQWIRRVLMQFSSQGAYEYSIRKQPGISSLPWRTSIHYPTKWGVVRESGVAKSGAFEYTTDLAKDASYRLLFQKNQ